MRQCAKVYFQLKMEIQNGQIKVQQGIEGLNRTCRNKGSENDSRIGIRVWSSCQSDQSLEEAVT